MNPAFQPDGPFASHKRGQFKDEVEFRLEKLRSASRSRSKTSASNWSASSLEYGSGLRGSMDRRPSLPPSIDWTPQMNPASQPDGSFALRKQRQFKDELEYRLEKLDDVEGVEVGKEYGMQPVSTLLEAEVHDAQLLLLSMTLRTIN